MCNDAMDNYWQGQEQPLCNICKKLMMAEISLAPPSIHLGTSPGDLTVTIVNASHLLAGGGISFSVDY